MIREMRKLCLLVIGALLLVLAGSATRSEAMGGRVDIGVNLPVVSFPAPPEVVVIPGSYVYMVPDINVDILFYQGYWWRPYEGRWYNSRDYNGSWRYVEPGRIPGGLRALPPDYRHRISPGRERIHHRDVQRNWERWEKEKYWDRRGDRDSRGNSDRDSRGKGDRDSRGKGDRDSRGQGNHDNQGRDKHKGRY